MIINTQKLRDAAETLDILASRTSPDDPMREYALEHSESDITKLYQIADSIDAEIPRLREAIQGLLNALPSAATHPAIKAARDALARGQGGSNDI